MLIDVLQPRDHTLHEDVAAAELLRSFMDDLLGAARVGRIALYEHTIRPSVSELDHGFLGFVLVGEVMDRDFLDSFSCELYGNSPADSPRAARHQDG